MDQQMTETQRLALATVAHAALGLRALVRSEMYYPSVLGREEVGTLRESLRSEMCIGLTFEPFKLSEQQLRELAAQKHPEFMIDVALAGVLSWLQELENVTLEHSEAAIAALAEHATPTLRRLRTQLEELLVYDCMMPVLTRGDEAFERRRTFWILRKYWESYRGIAVSCGTRMVAIAPHPMSRLIDNLRERIRKGMAALGDDELQGRIEAVLQMPFDSDMLDMFSEYVLPSLMEADAAVDRAGLAYGSGPLDLTPAEGLFLERIEGDLRTVGLTLDQAEKRLRGELQPGKIAPKDKAPNCWESIRAVEQRLRVVAAEAFEARYGTGWPSHVRTFLGPEATDAVKRTMEQRKVEDERELLHFTQLRELVALISGNWLLFCERGTLRRREFNTLAGMIIPGRTEEAHNRPAHIWTTLEQMEVTVACHKLLEAFSSK
jgi:hypothetical protein